VSCAGTTATTGLLFGDDSEDQNCYVNVHPGGSLTVLSGTLNYKNDEGTAIRYGDAIVLYHNNTGKYLRSSTLTYWQAALEKDVLNQRFKQVSGVSTVSNATRWIVKGAHAASQRWNCDFGTRVRHGDIIRLENLANTTNLHSNYNYPGPTSGNMFQVSGFINNISYPGQGDSKDNFEVELVLGALNKVWTSDAKVHLLHVYNSASLAQDVYLYTHNVNFETTNGGGQYEQEVVTSLMADSNIPWTVVEVDPAAYLAAG
jgi:dolichyl-phosphate-mannose--protein O-mannosyl transferase